MRIGFAVGRDRGADDRIRADRLLAHRIGTLNGQRAAVIQRLHAALPRQHVNLMQVALMHIRRQEDVHRLALADIGRAVGGVFDHPTLIEFEGRFVNRLLLLGQEIQMLHAALGGGDGGPHIIRIAPLLGEQLLQMAVAHREAARECLLQEHVRGDRLDARRGIARNDRDRGRGGNRHLVREAFHDAEIGGIRARAAFFSQHARGGIGLGADVLEHAQVPHLGNHALKRDVL